MANNAGSRASVKVYGSNPLDGMSGIGKSSKKMDTLAGASLIMKEQFDLLYDHLIQEE